MDPDFTEFNVSVGVLQETPLMMAVKFSDIELFDYLIAKGADANAKRLGNEGLLHVAVQNFNRKIT